MTDRLLFILKRNLGHGHHQTIKSPFQNRPARLADEARVGQKNKITRRWAKRGTRPSAPQDQRTASTYIFGAICPAEGRAAGLVLPWCNTEAMNLHVVEISARIAPAATPCRS